MIFTLGLQKLPFLPDSKQIIYVAGEKDEKVTKLVECHFVDIRNHFLSRGYTFCYIPYVKHDLLYGDRLHYNAPFAKSSKEADYMVKDDFILDYMTNQENRDKVTPSLLYYDPACRVLYPEAADLLRGITISESSFSEDHELRKVLDDILKDIRELQGKAKIRFHVVDTRPVAAEDGFRYEVKSEYADENFDTESRILIHEIEERIDKLRQNGIDSYLIEKMFSNKRTMLSRMRITKDYRIYLGDYFGMEIEMTPLQKAVYFLFLRHPEGIPFKWLPGYRRELMMIYSRLKPSSDTPASLRSIETVTDPTNNSINEKCSQIRAAFISKFDEHLAQYYFITGERGEPKGIKLPRKYVTWDKEVNDLFSEDNPSHP